MCRVTAVCHHGFRGCARRRTFQLRDVCVCVLQRVEAALASAWGGSGPAPLRPPPPSLFVASGSMATAGASPTKSEREPPFGFVREELARFSLESRGRSGGSSSSKGSGVRSSRDAADGRRMQSHLQLRSSSSSSSNSNSNSSDHSGDSEDSLQADTSTTAFLPGHAPRSTADAIMAQGSDSEVTFPPALPPIVSNRKSACFSTRRSFSSSRAQLDRLSGRPHRLSAAAVPAAVPLTCSSRSTATLRLSCVSVPCCQGCKAATSQWRGA